MIQNKIRRIIELCLILFVSLNSACTQETTKSINILAKDNHGQAIDHALVSINGKIIGVTDKDGALTHELSRELSEGDLLEIVKTSSWYHYSTHYQTITTDNINSKNSINFNVTLYSVPKGIHPNSSKHISLKTKNHQIR